MDASVESVPQAHKGQDSDGVRATARKLKKRELDRRAQRVARERTKNRIRDLESLVEQLKADTSSQQLTNVMSALGEVTQQRDKLQAVLQSLSHTIQRHIREPESPAPSPQPPRQLQTATENLVEDITDTNVNSQGSVSMDSSWGIDALPTEGSWIQPVQHLPEQQLHSCSSEDIIVPRPDWPCDCVQPGPDGYIGNTWRGANTALGKSTVLSPTQLVIEDFTSEDTPVRVVLDGWDSVAKAGKMSVSWWKLRKIDELCFSKCREVERIGILRTMHLLMTYHGDPSQDRCQKIPRWLWTRPSQAIPHSYAIDFFVWPGLRERFIFTQHRYCTNLFWQLFQSSLKLSWPFDLADCYSVDPDTGRYVLTPAFDHRLKDINAWRMSMDFFDHFPELCGDIPAIGSIAPSVGWSEGEKALCSHITGQEKESGDTTIHSDLQSGTSLLTSTAYSEKTPTGLGSSLIHEGHDTETRPYSLSLCLESECSWPSV